MEKSRVLAKRIDLQYCKLVCYPARWTSTDQHQNYLGADQASFTLNFSKGASQVLAQYYQLIRLGKAGFKSIMQNLTNDSIYISKALEETGAWKIMSAKGKEGLPLVAFRLKEPKHYDEFDIARELRQRQWVVPAYTMAPNASSLRMLRIVLREDFTRGRCDLFLRDLKASVDHLESLEKHEVEKDRDSHKKRQGAGRSKQGKAKGHKDTHSLQGKHGKSHGIC